MDIVIAFIIIALLALTFVMYCIIRCGADYDRACEKQNIEEQLELIRKEKY